MPPRAKADRTKEAIALGRRVAQLRKERGWTQEALAERAEMNWLQVGHVERGASDPKLSTIVKLAKALRVPAAELLRRGDS